MRKKVMRAAMIGVAALCAAVVVAAITVCAVFPNKYSSELAAAAEEFDLDTDLVKSVVWAESRFDRYAKSNKGAMGLMQLMPETFASCATALDMTDGDPYDAKTSLRCGCYYLRTLIDRFDGDETAALMAYNAGETNARKFLSGEKIFPETAGYLKNISLARKVYSTL